MKIDDLVKSTDETAVQMNNLAKYVANIITGGTDSSTSETSCFFVWQNGVGLHSHCLSV